MAKHTTSWELLINCFQEPQCYFLCYCTTDLATAAITVCLILSLSILHLHQRSHYGGVITKFEQKKRKIIEKVYFYVFSNTEVLI